MAYSSLHENWSDATMEHRKQYSADFRERLLSAIDWPLTTAAARIKLKRLYPQMMCDSPLVPGSPVEIARGRRDRTLR